MHDLQVDVEQGRKHGPAPGKMKRCLQHYRDIHPNRNRCNSEHDAHHPLLEDLHFDQAFLGRRALVLYAGELFG